MRYLTFSGVVRREPLVVYTSQVRARGEVAREECCTLVVGQRVEIVE